MAVGRVNTYDVLCADVIVARVVQSVVFVSTALNVLTMIYVRHVSRSQQMRHMNTIFWLLRNLPLRLRQLEKLAGVAKEEGGSHMGLFSVNGTNA